MSCIIFISGRGSHLANILQYSEIKSKISCVITDNPQAPGLLYAEKNKIPIQIIDYKKAHKKDRSSFDEELLHKTLELKPKWIFLMGFMRILSEKFVSTFYGKIINVHPSLLPSHPGLHTHKKALELGNKIHGCTIHIVSSKLDAGPIIIQGATGIYPHDTEESLALRVLSLEHQLYPKVIQWAYQNHLYIQGNQVKIPEPGYYWVD